MGEASLGLAMQGEKPQWTLTERGPGVVFTVASRVELPQVLDVPRVGHRRAIFLLQSRRSRARDVCHPEWTLPHRRELVQALSRQDPPQHQVIRLQSLGPDVVGVVSTKPLLVACRTNCSPVARLFEQEQIFCMDLTLPCLTIGKGSWRPKLEFDREDRLCSVYERERCFAGGLCRSRAD